MKLSEKIGYTFEHLLEIELTSRGVQVTRNEKPGNETIRSDITFSTRRKQFVIFVTHTKTQGMTNRKFYRTFEELAQRRILFPDAVCVEVTLTRDSIRTPSQYAFLFDSLFDASLVVIPVRAQKVFYHFVESLPTPVSKELVQAQLGSLPQSVSSGIKRVVDRILATRRSRSDAMVRYWKRERQVARGARGYSNSDATSVKLGLKQLSLLPTLPVSLGQIAQGRARVDKRQSVDRDHLLRIGVCDQVTKGLAGWELKFGKDAVVAAKALVSSGVRLSDDWYSEYLISPGASRLRSDIVDYEGTRQRLISLMQTLNGLQGASDLKKAFVRDFKNDEARCDLIDLAIRATGYSQNELSTAVQEELGITIRQRNPIWFVVAKEENVVSIVGDLERFVGAAAKLIWARAEGQFKDVSWEDFLEARIGTYFAHRSVKTEHVLLDAFFAHFSVEERNSLPSVLPRLVGLPSRFHMSVEAAIICSLPGNVRLFVANISTPDVQHHKHKEFSGKARAVRYCWDGTELDESVTRFLAIVDGNWSDEQIGMMTNAGWNVCGWNEFAEIASTKNELGNWIQ